MFFVRAPYLIVNVLPFLCEMHDRDDTPWLPECLQIIIIMPLTAYIGLRQRFLYMLFVFIKMACDLKYPARNGN